MECQICLTGHSLLTPGVVWTPTDKAISNISGTLIALENIRTTWKIHFTGQKKKKKRS